MDGRFRVLVIDDDPSVRRTTAAVLEDEGYVVDTAENVKEAIEKSNADPYRVALIDFRLPDMNGTQLLATLKETTPNIVEIMVTGYPTVQNAIECVNKHADAFFVKPVDYENLLNTIRNLIQKQQKPKNNKKNKNNK